MTTILPFYQVFMDVYHLILSSWNACLVLLQVIRLTVNEAQQEAAQLMEMLDDGDPVMVSHSGSLMACTTDFHSAWRRRGPLADAHHL